MRTFLGWFVALCALPFAAFAQEATVKEVHDAPAVRGSIIANMLQEHDNPFTLYPYESNYLLYTYTSDMNKEAIRSYSWSDEARKDEVKFQLSLAFPLWRGILGPNSCWALPIRKNRGGSFLIPRNRLLRHSAKPTMNHKCSSASPPITALRAGRCAILSLALTMTPMAVLIPHRVAGIASIRV
jgi:hypothetical protein